MEIWHHIAFNILRLPDALPAVKRSGIRHKTTKGLAPSSALISFDIAESDLAWESLRPFLDGALDIAHTRFTTDEVLASDWARLMPTFETGYPHPKDSWIPERPNFRPLCTTCGRYSQQAPFTIPKEPTLRGHHFMTLLWTYSLFANPSVIASLQEHSLSGLEIWDVILASSGGPSSLIKQIMFTEVLPASYTAHPDRGKTCPSCSLHKFTPHRVGPMVFRKDAFAGPRAEFLLTGDWFGDGKSAFQEMIVSRRVAAVLADRAWRGVALQPIALA